MKSCLRWQWSQLLFVPSCLWLAAKRARHLNRNARDAKCHWCNARCTITFTRVTQLPTSRQGLLPANFKVGWCTEMSSSVSIIFPHCGSIIFSTFSSALKKPMIIIKIPMIMPHTSLSKLFSWGKKKCKPIYIEGWIIWKNRKLRYEGVWHHNRGEKL